MHVYAWNVATHIKVKTELLIMKINKYKGQMTMQISNKLDFYFFYFL